MSALQGALRACALLCVTALSILATAQPYAHPQTVFLPTGKVPVARVTSVKSILQHYTAADLEMKTGDLIFAIDGIAVDSAAHFNELFESKTTDGSVRLDFLRDGIVHQTIGPLFRFERGIFKNDKPRWGGDLENTTADFAPSLLKTPVVRSIMAVKLSYIKANAAAANAGLLKDDLLLSINGRPIGRVSRSDIIAPLFPAGTPLTFVYLRDGKQLTGNAPLTIVKTGLAKTLSFGFSGESQMIELKSTDLPEALPKDVQVERPA